MFRNRLVNIVKSACQLHRTVLPNIRKVNPVLVALLTTVYCEEKRPEANATYEDDGLEHEFLIRQATTVNVNAATQLLTITLVAIHDTSERLREALNKEICLVQQALEWGEGTPPQHWDDLVAVRGTLQDLNYNLRNLCSYMDYAEKLATAAAEISYLAGNIAASDAICEAIAHTTRSIHTQQQLNHKLQQESLELQQQAIVSSPQLQDKLKDKSDKEIPGSGN